MAKMTKARKRQLNRVRRLRKSLANRGYILPEQVWDLNNLSTQKLAAMTPDWFYKNASYKISAEDYAAALNSPVAKYVGYKPGEVVSGIRGREIERARSRIKTEYNYAGRMWEIIREAQMRYADPSDAIGANQAANEMNRAISKSGIDVVEAHIKEMPDEFFARLDDLVSADYESLSAESWMTGRDIRDILEDLAVYLRDLFEAW